MQQFYITQKGRDRHESEIRNKRRTVATERRATTAMGRRKKSMVRARVGHCSMPLDVVRVIVESAITVYYPTTKNRREKLTKKVEWAGSKKYDELSNTYSSKCQCTSNRQLLVKHEGPHGTSHTGALERRRNNASSRIGQDSNMADDMQNNPT